MYVKHVNYLQVERTGHNKISVTGTSGVAAAWGLHYYLKTFCHAHVAWEGSQLGLPNILPFVNVTVTSNDR